MIKTTIQTKNTAIKTVNKKGGNQGYVNIEEYQENYFSIVPLTNKEVEIKGTYNNPEEITVETEEILYKKAGKLQNKKVINLPPKLRGQEVLIIPQPTPNNLKQ